MVIIADKYGRVPIIIGCEHKSSQPKVPPDDKLHAMDAEEVRRRYPRFEGYCPECGQRVISYGSAAHYVAGDW